MDATLIIWIIAIVVILALILWYFLSASKKKGKEETPKAPFHAPDNASPQGDEGYQGEKGGKDFPR